MHPTAKAIGLIKYKWGKQPLGSGNLCSRVVVRDELEHDSPEEFIVFHLNPPFSNIDIM